MSSGVGVHDDVKDLFNAMKVHKKGDDETERLRMVTFVIVDNVIQAADIVRQKDLDNVDDVYKYFTDLLKPKCGCYVLYDCHFETKESYKEELVFGMWNPDNSPVKTKMLYSSSKCALKKVFTGVKHDLQMNDFADLKDKVWFGKELGQNIEILEGLKPGMEHCQQHQHQEQEQQQQQQHQRHQHQHQEQEQQQQQQQQQQHQRHQHQEQEQQHQRHQHQHQEQEQQHQRHQHQEQEQEQQHHS